jgi:hypothetical protein
MVTSIHIKASELDEKFIKGIKAIYKSKKISITIEEEQDTTEYLLSTEANRKHLEKAVKNVKKGKTTKVDIDKYLPK